MFFLVLLRNLLFNTNRNLYWNKKTFQATAQMCSPSLDWSRRRPHRCRRPDHAAGLTHHFDYLLDRIAQNSCPVQGSNKWPLIEALHVDAIMENLTTNIVVGNVV